MKTYCRLLLLVVLALSTTGALARNFRAQDSTTRPNILVIMADDHGQWASQIYGNQDLRTPNMQWLADNGVVFGEAYAVSPVCSPSRASFFTGRMPSQHGVHDFLSEDPRFDHHWLQDEILLSEMLQASGYQTALVGKWHATTNSALVQRGFDYWFSYDVAPAGWSNQYQHRGSVHFSDKGDTISLNGFQSYHLTDKAIDFLDERSAEQPFFLFLGFVDTHAPFSGQPERLVAPFRHKSLRGVSAGESSLLPPRGEINMIPPDHLEQLAQYYAGIQMMDLQIGRLLDYLEAHHLLQNTVIIYTSDHGHMNGQHGLYGKGNATRPQNFYQEGILVPLTITYLQGITPQSVPLKMPLSTCDLHHTILDLGGVELPIAQTQRINSPGKSVLPLIHGKPMEWGNYKYCELGNARMIASAQFKYVQRMDPLVGEYTDEFYDLVKDPRENHNVIAHPAYQESLNTYKLALEQFFEKYQVPAHSGNNLSNQPPANANEQWRSSH